MLAKPPFLMCFGLQQRFGAYCIAIEFELLSIGWFRVFIGDSADKKENSEFTHFRILIILVFLA